jgi:predicted nucleic acid-binding protein
LLEYEEKLAEKVSPHMADIVLNAHINLPTLVKVEPKWRWNLIEADEDDNKFVDCAIAGQAEYIVSNDGHFKILNHIEFPLVLWRRLEEFVKELG